MKETFEKSLESGKPVLAAFISAGKEDAEKIQKLFSELEPKIGGKVKFVTVDCAYHSDLRKKYQIDNYPTLILFRGDEQLWRGNTHKAETVIESVNSFLA